MSRTRARAPARARPALPVGRPLRSVTAGLLVTTAAVGLSLLTACGSSSDSSGSGRTSPGTAGFSGSLPSVLASLEASGKAAASSAVSSARAAASSFAESAQTRVSGDSVEARRAVDAAVGKGNAIEDVTLVGLPRKDTTGLHAVAVDVVNHSGARESIAVKVEFVDSAGKVAASAVVGAPSLAPGHRAQLIAFSTEEPGVTLFPRVAKAQRY